MTTPQADLARRLPLLFDLPLPGEGDFAVAFPESWDDPARRAARRLSPPYGGQSTARWVAIKRRLFPLAAVAAERSTALYGVPTMFRAVLDDPAFDGTDVSSLRTGIMAGAPCPAELMRRVIDRLHMPEVAVGYGMSETFPISALSACDDALEDRVGTVGRVLPHLEISVRDPGTGRVLPRGWRGSSAPAGTA